MSYTFIFHKEFCFVFFRLKIIGYGNPDNNLETLCIYGSYSEEKNLLPLPGIEFRFLHRAACSLVTISTGLTKLLICSTDVNYTKRQRERGRVILESKLI
jgi:hypothetical protein